MYISVLNLQNLVTCILHRDFTFCVLIRQIMLIGVASCSGIHYHVQHEEISLKMSQTSVLVSLCSSSGRL